MPGRNRHHGSSTCGEVFQRYALDGLDGPDELEGPSRSSRSIAGPAYSVGERLLDHAELTSDVRDRALLLDHKRCSVSTELLRIAPLPTWARAVSFTWLFHDTPLNRSVRLKGGDHNSARQAYLSLSSIVTRKWEA